MGKSSPWTRVAGHGSRALGRMESPGWCQQTDECRSSPSASVRAVGSGVDDGMSGVGNPGRRRPRHRDDIVMTSRSRHRAREFEVGFDEQRPSTMPGCRVCLAPSVSPFPSPGFSPEMLPRCRLTVRSRRSGRIQLFSCPSFPPSACCRARLASRSSTHDSTSRSSSSLTT